MSRADLEHILRACKGTTGETEFIVIGSQAILGRYPDAPRALVLYVPLTTQHRLSQYEVPLPKLPYLVLASVANVQGLGSIPTARMQRRLGKLPAEVMARLKATLAFALDLET